jgi:amino acid adenylation domain-containing protein
MIWLSTQLDKNTSAYTRCSALHVAGHLSISALQLALTGIVERHEVLRSRIGTVDGTPRVYSFPVERVPLPVTDLSRLSAENREVRIRELLDAEARRPFDLDTGPWLRAGILKESDQASTLYISTHHIASDGWSDAVMFRELQELYGASLAGRTTSLPALSTRYRDFAAWQRQFAEEPDGRRHASYWRKRLAGAPVAQELPTDHARPEIPSMAGGKVSLVVPPSLVKAVESIGLKEGATLAMTTLAAFHLLQSRITGQSDTIVGLQLAGRTHAELENLIGMFSSAVPLRVTVDRQMTFRELLGAVRIAVLEAHEHQRVSVEEILEALPHPKGARQAEIARTMFNFRNMPAFEPSLPGHAVHSVATFNGSSVTDLDLEVVERGGGWECDLRFRTELFEEATARRLLGHYLTLLESIAANPDEVVGHLQLMTPNERHQILVDFNGPVRDLPHVLRIDELISEQAAKSPHAIAVASENAELTYGALEHQANALAHDLRSRGVANGDFVGICMDRSVEVVVSLLAVLKCGAAFVPFETDHPAERLAHMLADIKPVVVLADPTGASRLSASDVELLAIDSAYLAGLDNADAKLAVGEDRAEVVCVLHTSGSTGLPKGVLSTHRGIVNNLLAMQQMYPLTPDDCMLQHTSLGFDAAAWEIFWPLMVGAHTYMARQGGQRDAEYLAQVIRDQRVSTICFAPAMIKVLLDVPGFTGCADVRHVISIGEVLSPALQKKFFTRMPHAQLHNLYGPSETSITVTAWACEHDDTRRSVPIGRPMANSEVYILDAILEPVPIGVAGEIYIGGISVSNGYHNRPDLTAERFLPHPFHPGNGDRVYRTGDIARFGPDGVIEYIGRRDHQLKIRGVRVELGEIEAALDRLPRVRESVVVARPDADGEHRLIAYVAADEGAGSPLELRRALEGQLPSQFLPAVIVPLAEMPHGPNGKVDRAALPDPSTFNSALSRDVEMPSTDIEKRLATIWKLLLDVPEVGIRDSFFNLGGHSLLAVRMLQRVTDEIGDGISLRAFYAEPTIHAMATLLSGKKMPVTTLDSWQVLTVHEGDAGPPLFYFNGQPPSGGRYVHRLPPYLPADRDFYIVPLPIFDAPITVEGIAQEVIEVIRSQRPTGPYLLGGNCFGATLALEIAQQLRAAGERVPLVVLIHPDALAPTHPGYRVMRRLALMVGVPEAYNYAEFPSAMRYTARTAREIWRAQRPLSSRERIDRVIKSGRWLASFLTRNVRGRGANREADNEPPLADATDVGDQTASSELIAHRHYVETAWIRYDLKKYDGKVAIVWPVEGPANPPWDPRALWTRLTPDFDWRLVPGNHWSMLHEHFDDTARALGELVEGAEAS